MSLATKAQKKILLIEDEADLARLFEHALDRDGHQIRRAADADSGLAQLRRWKPDLLLLDIVLPGMSGLELLEALRRESEVPVILISGRRRPADLAAGKRHRADYLAKPFSLSELRSRVKLTLARARAKPTAPKRSPARRPAARSVPR